MGQMIVELVMATTRSLVFYSWQPDLSARQTRILFCRHSNLTRFNRVKRVGKPIYASRVVFLLKIRYASCCIWLVVHSLSWVYCPGNSKQSKQAHKARRTWRAF